MAATNVTVELFYPSSPGVTGTWHNITSAVYTRDGIRITRGRPDEVQQIPPSTLDLTLDNRSGTYSPRNPSSSLYGLIGRNTPIRVSVNGSYRFYGEVESWPQRWSVDGRDVWAPITANGIMRRLNAPGTTTPSKPALRRAIDPIANQLIGYWSLEDLGQNTSSAPSLLPGGASMPIIDGAASRSLDDTLPGAGPVQMVTLAVNAPGGLGASNFGGSSPDAAPLLPSTGNSWSLMFWTRTRLLDLNEATTTVSVSVPMTGSAQIGNWFFAVRHNNFTVEPRVELTAFATDPGGTLVAAVGNFTENVAYVDDWRAFRVNIDLLGTDHRLRLYFDETLIRTVTVAGYTPGQPSGFRAQAQATLTSAVPLSIGYVLLSGGTGSDIIDDNAATLFSAGRGYVGETATARMARLCAEDGIAFTLADAGASEPVGVQRIAPFLSLLQDAADADGGILHEPRDELGLAYRTHVSLYNQASAVTLNYAAGNQVAPPLEPVEDTDVTANDVTVTRYLGGSASVVQETGPLNVQEPSDDPQGVGRYRHDVTLVLASDSQCLSQAAWRRHLGTWDEARYPVVTVEMVPLASAPVTGLVASTTSLDIGDRFTITNPPSWLPPDSIEQHAQGFTETIDSHTWTIAINATPALPYNVLQLETDTTNNLSRIPAASGATTLNEALDTTETGVDIISARVRWIDSATYASQFPFDITVGGERMRVTACTGTTLTQTFTVTRSINGVVKSHAIGTAVQLFRPPVIAR